jgi:hypothetical protein
MFVGKVHFEVLFKTKLNGLKRHYGITLNDNTDNDLHLKMQHGIYVLCTVTSKVIYKCNQLKVKSL